MSESCDVCIGGGVDETYDSMELTTFTARAPAKCCECGAVIPVGAGYEKAVGKYGDDAYIHRTCASCVEIRDVFTCGKDFTFESLWSDMEDYAFPNLTTASPCFRELSPANKARVLERWREWKFRGAA